jgi:glycosyltransferase involved in cell wall biosynthesis
MMAAKISTIVPSYNHEAFITEALVSVLNQTVPVDEVIVVDDASTDRSLDYIRSNPDVRIRLIALEKNQGGAEALNIGITEARNEFIAICNSDDVWEPEKIERQLALLEPNPDIAAVFCDVDWIGRHGESIGDTLPFDNVFRERNRTRHEWLRRLFAQGNCLCHPSILIRKAVYDRVGRYDNRLRQLPDYHMWLRVLQHFDIHVLPDKLVRFRIHTNTSASSPATLLRDHNEFLDIATEFFQSLNRENFWRSFGSKIAPFDPRFDLTVEKILYLWSSGVLQPPRPPVMASWLASSLAMDLLKTDAGQKIWASYGLTMRDFHTLRGIESPWHPSRQLDTFSAEEKAVLRMVGGGDRLESFVDFVAPLTSVAEREPVPEQEQLPELSEISAQPNVTNSKLTQRRWKFWRKLDALRRHPFKYHKRKSFLKAHT